MDCGRSSALSPTFGTLCTRGMEIFLRPTGLRFSIVLRLFLLAASVLFLASYLVVQILFLPFVALVSM